jgi:hypothetical protein
MRTEFTTLGIRQKYIVMVVPTLVFAQYGDDCKYRFSLQLCWLNWSVGVKWFKHSTTYTAQ